MPSLGDRIFPGVSPLNNGQIVILGGNDAIWNFMSDCHVFDVQAESVQKICMLEYPVATGAIPSMRIERNVVLAVGQWSKEIIEYDHCSGQIRAVT